MKKPYITIGIPTCYGTRSLLRVVKNLNMTFAGIPHEIIIIADSVPIKESMKKEFKKLGVKLTENDSSGSQFQKLQQAINQSQGEYFVFTQDDVSFDENTGKELYNSIQKNPDAAMFSAKFASTKPETRMEEILDVGVRIVYRTVKNWNNGNNYLAANGRLLAFKTNFLKSFKLPLKVVNGDAYLYFKAVEKNAKIVHMSKSIVYNNNPKTLEDYMSQNKRFRYSHEELSKYFNFKLDNYYKIPKKILLKSIFIEAFKTPLYFLSYLIVMGLIKFKHVSRASVANTSWKTVSTKR